MKLYLLHKPVHLWFEIIEVILSPVQNEGEHSSFHCLVRDFLIESCMYKERGKDIEIKKNQQLWTFE